MIKQVPKVAWFAKQREALGLEALVYAFMAVGVPALKPYDAPLRFHALMS